MLTLVLKFNYYQVKIISVSDGITTDDENSKLGIQMWGLINELYLDDFRKGQARYEGMIHKINPDEVDVIRRIFKEFSEGKKHLQNSKRTERRRHTYKKKAKWRMEYIPS
jgi:DNA invertase Pin-like site-specific DNA recombinase